MIVTPKIKFDLSIWNIECTYIVSLHTSITMEKRFWYVWFLLNKIDFACRIDSNLKLGFIAFESKNNLYIEIYCSIHFYVNVFKHKAVYIQLTYK